MRLCLTYLGGWPNARNGGDLAMTSSHCKMVVDGLPPRGRFVAAWASPPFVGDIVSGMVLLNVIARRPISNVSTTTAWKPVASSQLAHRPSHGPNPGVSSRTTNKRQHFQAYELASIIKRELVGGLRQLARQCRYAGARRNCCSSQPSTNAEPITCTSVC